MGTMRPVPSVPTSTMGAAPGGTPGQSNANVVPIVNANPVNSTQQAQQNPYVPALNIPGSTTPALSTYNGNDTVAGDFTQTYGQGTGTALINTLAGLGTATDSAVQATSAASYQNAQQASAGIDSHLAAAGLSKDSSASALSQGDFWSNWSTGLNSTISNMELGEENTLINSLTTEGQAHGGDPSAWDTFSDVLGSVGSIAGQVASGFAV